MVFSNEAMLKIKNLNGIKPRDSLTTMIHEQQIHDIFTDTDGAAEKMLSEKFYGPNNSDLLGGKERLDHAIYAVHLASLLGEQKIKEGVDSYFEKCLLQYKSSMFDGLEELTVKDNLTIPVESSMTDLRLKLITSNADEKSSVKYATKLIFENSIEAAKYFRDNNDKFPSWFPGYKKDIIDKTPKIQDKISKMAKFLYVEMAHNGGYLEKDAVDYFVDLTRYDPIVFYDPYSNICHSQKQNVKSWLKRHNNAKSFIELTQDKDNDSIYDLDLILSIMSLFEVPFFGVEANKKIKPISQEFLQKVFVNLSYDVNLRDNPKAVDIILYFIYAFYPVIQQAKTYSREFLKTRFMLERERCIYKEEISKIKAEAAPLEDIISEKQDKLNKAQLELDKIKRSKDREIAKLQSNLAKLKEANNKLAADNKILSDLNNELSSRLDKIDIEDKSGDSIENLLPNSYIQDRLKEKNIVIMGGHQIWQNKLKELYPYFTYIDADNVNYDINITRNADIILFNTLHCSHTLYYRVKNNTNNGRTDNKNKLIYIGSNNLNYFRDVITNLITDKK